MWKRNGLFLLVSLIGARAWCQQASLFSAKPLASSLHSKTALTTETSWKLYMEKEDGNGGNDSEETKPRQNQGRFGPLGGRKKRRQVKLSENDNKFSFPLWGVSLLLGAFLLGKIFGWGDDPSFVYYESSVYETRVYNRDGRVETSRKESFRSNIPTLVEEQQRQRGDSELMPPPLLEDSIMDEMDQAIRIQEKFIDEFF
ncbi:expressed unknown protein [Seminavis robusta]|uniref:Transmembrane protein n=1 Tax=Seminavis robusta TaxID=568900 RepID=A0A9N8D788_9STRA|nr:expressed unknown protein [Seminavis robusta]|eukprot:Sro26_g017500.1 n/a (200) ;mRNA; r:39231-39830